MSRLGTVPALLIGRGGKGNSKIGGRGERRTLRKSYLLEQPNSFFSCLRKSYLLEQLNSFLQPLYLWHNSSAHDRNSPVQPRFRKTQIVILQPTYPDPAPVCLVSNDENLQYLCFDGESDDLPSKVS